MPHVFVYGTLLVPEMMQAVTGEHYRSAPATAHGYVRFYLKGRVYPGIVAQPGSSVAGLVYLDVTDEAIARLDYFEGPEYVRESLQVQLGVGETVQAEAYVVPIAKRGLLTDRPWDLDDFARYGLADFLQHARQAILAFSPGDQVKR